MTKIQATAIRELAPAKREEKNVKKNPKNNNNDNNNNNNKKQKTAVVIGEQTGGGKTLSYAVPIVCSILPNTPTSPSSSSPPSTSKPTVRAVVVVPTSELAMQVGKVFKNLSGRGGVNFKTVVAGGGDDNGKGVKNVGDSVRKSKLSLKKGGCDVLVGTPGRILSLVKSRSIVVDEVEFVVCDEFDVLLTDDSFKEQLGGIAKGMGNPGTRFVFTSATCPKDVVNTVKEEFGNSETEIITGPGLHRAPRGVEEFVVEARVEEKEKAVEDALREGKCERTVVFCNTVEGVRKVENRLKRRDRGGKVWNVLAYHGGMTKERRESNMREFVRGREGRDGVIIATDRAARGVDFGGMHVGHVIIYEFPKSSAEYVRRVGRTGRGGRKGRVTVIVGGEQGGRARRMVGGGKLEVEIEKVGREEWDDFGGEEGEEGGEEEEEEEEEEEWGGGLLD
ncbi:hypothetical protein TrCOL_g9965 [Triparma columacea]|uniref:Uncharacterized protein n=1 Tax=Triparma columacea TaxID=722753 RepID=A0A9W7G815_9STRA|nr:hypothetical protein TrCOL_g9965 [Triparma columacea]